MDDLDKLPPFDAGATPRRSTSSLEPMESAAFLLGIVLSLTAVAHPRVNCGLAQCDSEAPTFEEHFVPANSHAALAPLDLRDNPRAKRFRTVLQKGVASGPNFAGHYTVVTWGCGVACLDIAIVDSDSGKVHFPSALKLNAYHLVREDPLPPPFQFDLGSNLLVVVGSPNDSAQLGVFYYLWEDPTLRLIYRQLREWPP